MSDLPSPERPTTAATARWRRILRDLSAAALGGTGQLVRTFASARRRPDRAGGSDDPHAAHRGTLDDGTAIGSNARESKDFVMGDGDGEVCVSVVRFSSGRYLVTVSDEEGSLRFPTDFEPEAIAIALGFSPSERFSVRCEALLAGPFDRRLAGWRQVAADWWEEQGEEQVAVALRRAEILERRREIMKDMTLDERAAYLRSLPD